MLDYTRLSFSNDWFDRSTKGSTVKQLMVDARPVSVLEIGCFEGRFTCFSLENFANLGVHTALDTFGGSPENSTAELGNLLSRFRANVAEAEAQLSKQSTVGELIGRSCDELPLLLAGGLAGKFDLVYVDGSHDGRDVLMDLVYSYLLCATGGLIVCDDYGWNLHRTLPELAGTWSPKPAVDAFVKLFGTVNRPTRSAKHKFDNAAPIASPRVELLHKGYQVALRKLL